MQMFLGNKKDLYCTQLFVFISIVYKLVNYCLYVTYDDLNFEINMFLCIYYEEVIFIYKHLYSMNHLYVFNKCF